MILFGLKSTFHRGMNTVHLKTSKKKTIKGSSVILHFYKNKSSCS